mmetsp:Transcript_30657/g.30979  ORF Transcript_30657/g.30979 Transcript_30657/m.30979 type:complete len:81 (+) Transcript_30657:58-300(+)
MALLADSSIIITDLILFSMLIDILLIIVGIPSIHVDTCGSFFHLYEYITLTGVSLASLMNDCFSACENFVLFKYFRRVDQ